MDTLFENLTSLGAVEAYHKCIVTDGRLTSSGYSLQPVFRTMWNFCYGGADREQVLAFIKLLLRDSRKMTQDARINLTSPYVRQNYHSFDLMIDQNKRRLTNIKSLVVILPPVVTGIQNLRRTYVDDTQTSLSLDSLAAEFDHLHTTTNAFIKNFVAKKNKTNT